MEEAETSVHQHGEWGAPEQKVPNAGAARPSLFALRTLERRFPCELVDTPGVLRSDDDSDLPTSLVAFNFELHSKSLAPKSGALHRSGVRSR